MISAYQALALPQSKLTGDEMVMFRAVMKTIDAHIRKLMTFGGPSEPLIIPMREMNGNVCALMLHTMKKHGWVVSWQIGHSEMSRIRSAPDRWQIIIGASDDAYADTEAVKEATKYSGMADGSEVFQ